ncbi:hypothetical protein IH785_13745 [candidate division KSB1 bacterium]|nr:hypothetical protein [candidate division KSB1 bacterium]
MWFFEKKVTEEEFSKFQKQVQKSFQKVKADNRDLENQLTVLTKVTMALSPLSKRFTELLKQFSGGSLNRQKKVEPSPPQLKEEKKQPSGFSDIQSGHLTQLEQKGLIFIGRLQNESGSQRIPVGSLTSNLYPDRVNRRIKTTVSNILKKQVELGLVNRERRGNCWYIALTSRGYKAVKKVLHQNQLKNLMQLYEKK